MNKNTITIEALRLRSIDHQNYKLRRGVNQIISRSKCNNNNNDNADSISTNGNEWNDKSISFRFASAYEDHLKISSNNESFVIKLCRKFG